MNAVDICGEHELPCDENGDCVVCREAAALRAGDAEKYWREAEIRCDKLNAELTAEVAENEALRSRLINFVRWLDSVRYDIGDHAWAEGMQHLDGTLTQEHCGRILEPWSDLKFCHLPELHEGKCSEMV